MKTIYNRLKSNSLVRGSAVSLILKIIGIGSGYLLFWVLSKKGGAAKVGEFSLGFNYLQLMGQLATIGLPVALLRFGAPLADKHRWSALRDLRKKTLILQISAGVFFGLVSFVFGDWISRVFFKQEMSLLFKVLISVGIPFFGINLISADLIRTLGIIKVSEFFRSIFVPFVTVLVIALLWFLGSSLKELYVYLVVIIIAAVFGLFAGTVLLRGKAKRFPEEFKEKAVGISKLLKTALPMTITSFALLFMGKINIFFLGYYYGAYEVGLFTIPLKLASTTSIILQAVNIIMGPKIAAQYWSGNMEEVQRTLQHGARLSFVGSLPFILIFLIFPKFCLSLFGPEFIQTFIVLIILVVGQIANAWCGSIAYFLNMTGDEKILSVFIVSALIISIILNTLLIPRYGIMGAAIATTLSLIFWNLVSTIYLYIKSRVKTFLH